MDNNIIKSDRLIIPIYINEKIVLDMRLILISELTDLKRQMNRDTEWKLQKLSLELFIKMTV